jgi:hypothetical protein
VIEIRTILAPTDFSAHSERAVRYACGLAERLGAELHLLHVLSEILPAGPDPLLMPVMPPEYYEENEERANETLARLVQPDWGTPHTIVTAPPTILQKVGSWRQSSPERGSDRDMDKAGRQAGSEPLPVGTVQEGVIPPWRDGPAHDARLTCFGISRRAAFKTTCSPPSMTACSPPAYR